MENDVRYLSVKLPFNVPNKKNGKSAFRNRVVIRKDIKEKMKVIEQAMSTCYSQSATIDAETWTEWQLQLLTHLLKVDTSKMTIRETLTDWLLATEKE